MFGKGFLIFGESMTEEEKKNALYNFVQAWKIKNKISCPEVIYQCDWLF